MVEANALTPTAPTPSKAKAADSATTCLVHTSRNVYLIFILVLFLQCARAEDEESSRIGQARTMGSAIRGLIPIPNSTYCSA